MKRNHPLEEAKRKYQSVEIPQELNRRVNAAIELGESKLPAPRRHWARNSLCSALACCAVLVVALNTSQVFAEAVFDIPVLGNIARVFTFREYQEQNNISNLDIKIPVVSSTGHPELEDRINQEIQTRIDSIVKQTKEEDQKNYESYLKEFGSVPETGHHSLTIDYEVKRSDEQILSFVINRTDVMASGYTEQYFYNIDMKSGKELTLEDILGSGYKRIADESIQKQIKERMEKDPSLQYFDGSEGVEGFTGISDHPNFYVNAAGNAVICFSKYEIAPGYMGLQEFEIIPN